MKVETLTKKNDDVRILSDVFICVERRSRLCIISEAFDKNDELWGEGWYIRNGGAICMKCARGEITKLESVVENANPNIFPILG